MDTQDQSQELYLSNHIYKARKLVERFLNKIKHFDGSRPATTRNFLAVLKTRRNPHLAAR